MGDEGQVGGISRRDLMKVGAVAGGLVWAAPVLESFGSKAFAQTAGSPAASNISFVAFCVTCGPSTFRIKFDNNSGTISGPSCGDTSASNGGFCADTCCDQELCNGNFTTGCGGFTSSSASLDSSGNLVVTLPSGCTVNSSVTKCGTCCTTTCTQSGSTLTCNQCPSNQCEGMPVLTATACITHGCCDTSTACTGPACAQCS